MTSPLVLTPKVCLRSSRTSISSWLTSMLSLLFGWPAPASIPVVHQNQILGVIHSWS